LWEVEMADHRIAFTVTFVCMGLLFVALAVPLIRGRVKPNCAYGVRIPAAFASEEAWYRVNRHGGFCLLAFGLAHVLLGCIDFLFLPASPSRFVFQLQLYAPAILLIPFLVAVFLYPRR
jgi:hypothetical protein